MIVVCTCVDVFYVRWQAWPAGSGQESAIRCLLGRHGNSVEHVHVNHHAHMPAMERRDRVRTRVGGRTRLQSLC
jgi:hypothetical protein